MGKDLSGQFDRIMQRAIDVGLGGSGRLALAAVVITEFDEMGWDTQGECETRSDIWIDEAFRRVGHTEGQEDVPATRTEAPRNDSPDGQRPSGGVQARGSTPVRRRGGARGPEGQ